MKNIKLLPPMFRIGLVLFLLGFTFTPNSGGRSQKLPRTINLQNESIEIGLKWVSQFGGPTYDVYVDGDIAYFNVGPRLVIWNIGTPSVPQFLGQSPVLADTIVDISIQGNYAYLACDSGGLRILDVNNPYQPYEVGSYQIDGLPDHAYGVDIVGGTAYVVDRIRGLRIINVQNPSNPQEVGSYDTPGFATDVEVVGSYAYIADEAYRLTVVDISVPSNPVEVVYDTYYPSGYVWGVEYANGYLYVAHDDGMDVVNIADPYHPALVGSYTSNDVGMDIAINGNTGYLVADGVEILDLSDPTNPTRISSYTTQTYAGVCPGVGGASMKPCRGISLYNNYFLVADDSYGLHIVNSSDLNTPYLEATYRGVGRVNDIAIENGYTFAAERDRGVHILNTHDPYNPQLISTYPMTGTVAAVESNGALVFVGNGGGFYVIDVSDPSKPNQIGYTISAGEPNHISIAGGFAYITTGFEWDGFGIIDIHDPTNPQRTGSVFGDDMVAGGYDLALSGDLAYVADWGTVRIVNIANPFSPFLIGTHYPSTSHSYIYGIAADQNTAYYPDAEYLNALDVTNPTSPTVSVISSGMGWGMDIGLINEYAIVAAEQYGLHLVDIPGHMVSTLETPGLAWEVDIENGFIYVALGDGGIGIFSIGQSSSGLITTAGGSLALPSGQVILDMPSGTFPESVVVTMTLLAPEVIPPPPTGMLSAGLAFSIEAVSSSSGLSIQPSSSYQLETHYDPNSLGPIIEDTLGIYSWNGSIWQLESASGPDNTTHTITANPNHFSNWAIFGETKSVYLPLTIR